MVALLSLARPTFQEILGSSFPMMVPIAILGDLYLKTFKPPPRETEQLKATSLQVLMFALTPCLISAFLGSQGLDVLVVRHVESALPSLSATARDISGGIDSLRGR